jgi:peroxiredoxin
VTADRRLSLGDLAGRPVILVFYPGDWNSACDAQLSLYNEILPEFRKYGAELVGVSVDSVWCHAAYAERRNLHFPLLADFHPKGAVAKKYGTYRHRAGLCEPAIFLIDRQGTIFWSHCAPIGVNPGADGILDALERLSAEEDGGSGCCA